MQILINGTVIFASTRFRKRRCKLSYLLFFTTGCKDKSVLLTLSPKHTSIKQSEDLWPRACCTWGLPKLVPDQKYKTRHIFYYLFFRLKKYRTVAAVTYNTLSYQDTEAKKFYLSKMFWSGHLHRCHCLGPTSSME